MKADKKESVIPDLKKDFPAMNVPPKGIEAFQMAPDGNHWSVWKFTINKDGNVETSKVSEMEPFELAKIKVGTLTIESQMQYLK